MMKISQEKINPTQSPLNSLIITYHLEISHQLPNPPDHIYLSLLSPQGLVSSLQLTTNSLMNSSLSNQQSKYETVLRQLEAQNRARCKELIQMKLQKEAMSNKIASLLQKEEEALEALDLLKQSKAMLIEKENEILILRAENSNLKAIHFKMTEEIAQLQSQIEDLKKQFIDYNINLHSSNSNSNINININDISNSKVIIKSDEGYSSPNKRRNRNNSDIEYDSNLNRNVFISAYKLAFSPCKTSTGSQCQTKPNKTKKHSLIEKESVGIVSASTGGNTTSLHADTTLNTRKSPSKTSSSRKYPNSLINRAFKSLYTSSPKTVRNNCNSNKKALK